MLPFDNAVIRFGEAASDARGGDTIVGVDLVAVDAGRRPGGRVTSGVYRSRARR